MVLTLVFVERARSPIASHRVAIDLSHIIAKRSQETSCSSSNWRFYAQRMSIFNSLFVRLLDTLREMLVLQRLGRISRCRDLGRLCQSQPGRPR